MAGAGLGDVLSSGITGALLASAWRRSGAYHLAVWLHAAPPVSGSAAEINELAATDLATIRQLLENCVSK